MTTLGIMKDRIARETRRGNIQTQIAEAIATAIDHYQGERFWFNVSRELTFDTVADAEFYDGGTGTYLQVFEKIEYVTLEIEDNQVKPLLWEEPALIEDWAGQSTQTGEPRFYTVYDGRLRLYPIPDGVYTVRIAGQRNTAAPAADDETGNPWMTDAANLIRYRALFELFAHVIVDPERAQIASGAADDALSRLRSRTATKQQQGGWVVTPTDF